MILTEMIVQYYFIMIPYGISLRKLSVRQIVEC